MKFSNGNTEHLSTNSIVSNASSPNNHGLSSDYERRNSFVRSLEDSDRKLFKETCMFN